MSVLVATVVILASTLYLVTTPHRQEIFAEVLCWSLIYVSSRVYALTAFEALICNLRRSSNQKFNKKAFASLSLLAIGTVIPLAKGHILTDLNLQLCWLLSQISRYGFLLRRESAQSEDAANIAPQILALIGPATLLWWHTISLMPVSDMKVARWLAVFTLVS